MNQYVLLSIIEAIYIIYMYNYFKTTIEYEHTDWGWVSHREIPENTTPQIKHLTRYGTLT